MLPLLYPRHSLCSHGNQQTAISLLKKTKTKDVLQSASKK